MQCFIANIQQLILCNCTFLNVFTGITAYDRIDGRQPISPWLFWRAVIAGCMLAASIIILYLWIHVQYINPMIVEIFKISPHSNAIPIPKINHLKLIDPEPIKSKWRVDYDLPAGIPVIKLYARDMKNSEKIVCPPGKFALALYLDSDSELAENWLKVCGPSVAYFRIDGNPTQGDVENLIVYIKDAQYLPLKVALRVEKGGILFNNPDFQRTMSSDEVIKSVEISGYATPKTIEELVDAVPYAEEITIKGNEVCKSLRRSLKSSCEVITWQVLQKLHIFDTEECRGLYDLIYSCWEMPLIETLQIRKSIISGPNSDYIKGILDRYRITKVDFADNTCFDETLQTYPFMCQASL